MGAGAITRFLGGLTSNPKWTKPLHRAVDAGASRANRVAKMGRGSLADNRFKFQAILRGGWPAATYDCDHSD